MSPSQRVGRLLASGVVLSALAIGTIWGDDTHYPFGPFRMYSTRNDPNGTISVVRVYGTTSRGTTVSLHSRSFGLRPAEIDGLLLSFEDNSELAGYLLDAYENVNDGPELIQLRVARGIHQLEQGQAVSYSEQTLGQWRRSD